MAGVRRPQLDQTLLSTATVAGTTVAVPGSGVTYSVYTDSARTTLATIYSTATGSTTVTQPLAPDIYGRLSQGNAYLPGQGRYYWSDSGGQTGEFFIPAPAYYTAEEYGAVGNGTTDDATAIRAAITAATTDGVPEVRLLDRTYRINSGIAMKTSVILRGAGMGRTILQFGTGTLDGSVGGGGAIAFASTVTDAGFCDLTIDGNSNTVTGMHGVAVVGATRCWGERFEVKNYGAFAGGLGSFRALDIGPGSATTPATDCWFRHFWLHHANATNGAAAAVAIGASGNGTAGVRGLTLGPGLVDHSAVTIGATDLSLFGVEIVMAPTTFTSLARCSLDVLVFRVRVVGAYTRAVHVSGGACDVTLLGCVSEGIRNNPVTVRTNGAFQFSNYPGQGAGGWAAGTQPTYDSGVTVIGCRALGQVGTDGAYTATSAGDGFVSNNDNKRVGLHLIGCLADHMALIGYNLHGQTDITVTDCKATDNASHGFQINADGSTPGNTHLVNCISERNADRGIRFVAGATDCRWYGGRLNNNTNGPVLDGGTRTKVLDCVDYVTENWGAQAAVTDGATIAHGLAAAPTLAVAQATVASQFASVTAVDGTNITVALKTDTGAAGSSQTVRWYARV